jgi:hypothetical protein
MWKMFCTMKRGTEIVTNKLVLNKIKDGKEFTAD